MLSSPKGIAIAVFLLAVALISVLGGALGAAFGGGFLGGAVPLIQIPSELVGEIAGYKLVNTVVMFALAALVLVLITVLATRKISEVPGRWQAIMELLYEFFIGSSRIDIGQNGPDLLAGRDSDLPSRPLLELAWSFAGCRHHRTCGDYNRVVPAQI